METLRYRARFSTRPRRRILAEQDLRRPRVGALSVGDTSDVPRVSSITLPSSSIVLFSNHHYGHLKVAILKRTAMAPQSSRSLRGLPQAEGWPEPVSRLRLAMFVRTDYSSPRCDALAYCRHLTNLALPVIDVDVTTVRAIFPNESLKVDALEPSGVIRVSRKLCGKSKPKYARHHGPRTNETGITVRPRTLEFLTSSRTSSPTVPHTVKERRVSLPRQRTSPREIHRQVKN